MKNLKRKMFKVIFFIMVLLLIILIINRQMLISSHLSQEKAVQQEQKKQIKAQANLFVQKISDTIQLGLVSYVGKYEITHDRTPENNPWTEWLWDAQLQMIVTYQLTIAVATSDIQMHVSQTGAVTIQLDEKDFYPMLEVKKIAVYEEGSILGKEYTASETIALEQIAKEDILSHVDNTKLSRASQNLSHYLKQVAKQLGLPDTAITVFIHQ